MPALALLECPAYAGIGVPHIVRDFAGGVGAAVIVNQLPIRWQTNSEVIECAGLFVFGKVEDMRMCPGELGFCLLAERIMPDYPVTHHQA